MIAGRLMVENFRIGVSDAEFPLYDNGVPITDGVTGEQKTSPFKVILIQALDDVTVELRVPEEDWPEFIEILTEKPVIETATLADLRRLT